MSEERLSLQKKRSARIAAIQGVYHSLVMDKPLNPEQQAEQLIAQWKEPANAQDAEWEHETPPESALLYRLLNGVASHFDALTSDVESLVKEGWSSKRMNPVMRGLLIVASCEFQHHDDVKTPILLSEYSDIAAGFLDEPELGFAHSALQQLAEKHRPAQAHG